jgi:hypothetical protein
VVSKFGRSLNNDFFGGGEGPAGTYRLIATWYFTFTFAGVTVLSLTDTPAQLSRMR